MMSGVDCHGPVAVAPDSITASDARGPRVHGNAGAQGISGRSLDRVLPECRRGRYRGGRRMKTAVTE